MHNGQGDLHHRAPEQFKQHVSFKDGLSFALVMLFVCVYVTGG